jgi:hypothetical protein
MANLFRLPDWITGIIAGVLGFLAKTAYDTIITKRKNKKLAITKLKEFADLLKLGKSIFHDQIILRNRLYNSFPNHNEDCSGYSSFFLSLYDTMNENQKETFHLIRGITENSIFSLNQSLNNWVTENSSYTLTTKKSTIVDQFEKDSNQLKEHLSLWFAKFNSLFKNNPKYCLVYLGDEENHGTEFPPTIEKSISEMIDFLQN